MLNQDKKKLEWKTQLKLSPFRQLKSHHIHINSFVYIFIILDAHRWCWNSYIQLERTRKISRQVDFYGFKIHTISSITVVISAWVNHKLTNFITCHAQLLLVSSFEAYPISMWFIMNVLLFLSKRWYSQFIFNTRNNNE